MASNTVEILSGSRTSFGPRVTEQQAMAKFAVAGPERYLIQEANGEDLFTWTSDTPLDETIGTIPANSFIKNIYFYANTAVAVNVDLAFVRRDTGAATGPAVAAVLVAASAGDWARTAVNATIGTEDAVAEYTGPAAGELATVLIEFLLPLTA